ncbi:hypothetical protein P261_00797 [Lachnospiraceae bacterium TWA4]|nr:hypothetical protein P261_00797 [Lachnospiraceae bacterium TWA4]
MTKFQQNTKTLDNYELLARGEYNINYLNKKTNQILRKNCGSQMHLDDQIGYEFHVLKLLEPTNRTPKVYSVDSNEGTLVMEYLPGHHLDYQTELSYVAPCLADIHSLQTNGEGLICPNNPLEAILEECKQMIEIYQEPIKREKIDNMLQVADLSIDTPYRCIINTELNSTNFLIDGDYCRLVDWEKPLYADPAQDLGHFLAPTTTFWKTDVILTKSQMDDFIDRYIVAVNGRYDVSGLRERTYKYVKMNCLRGVTWCAMAWIQYQEPGKEIKNESTWKKLGQYLDIEFLDMIEEFVR